MSDPTDPAPPPGPREMPAIPDEWWAKLGTDGFDGRGAWISVAPRDVAEQATRHLDLLTPVLVGISPAAHTRLVAEAVAAERERIAPSIEKALLAERKRCAAICEMHRQNILRDPNDPSFTEHLASAGSDICMGVEPSPVWLADAEGQGIPAGAVTEQVAKILGASGLDAADGGAKGKRGDNE